MKHTPQPAQVVMITGAGGHLAQAVAQRFAQDGAKLLLLAHHAQKLQQAWEGNADALVVQADLRDPAQVAQAVADGCARFGRIDALAHIAGGFRMGEAVHETSADSWDFLMDLNARTFLNVARALVPRMLQQGAGRIVTVGAAAATKGAAHMGAYAASKSALIRLTESMSAELKERRINVNCVLPSIIDTADNRAAMPKADFSRWVAPEALADVIAFLCSDAARAIHGVAIPVTGLV
jgi:NAD(P)-dependent dehydrogenase (short-subunit alcohol dehydrogenase family)